MTRQQKYKIQTIARYIILIAVGLVMIYPMIWMVGASFKATNAEIFGSIGFIPKEFTLDGYKNGWFASTYQFGRYMVNTYKFVIPKVIGTVVSSAIAAYGFSATPVSQNEYRIMLQGLICQKLFIASVLQRSQSGQQAADSFC